MDLNSTELLEKFIFLPVMEKLVYFVKFWLVKNQKKTKNTFWKRHIKTELDKNALLLPLLLVMVMSVSSIH